MGLTSPLSFTSPPREMDAESVMSVMSVSVSSVSSVSSVCQPHACLAVRVAVWGAGDAYADTGCVHRRCGMRHHLAMWRKSGVWSTSAQTLLPLTPRSLSSSSLPTCLHGTPCLPSLVMPRKAGRGALQRVKGRCEIGNHFCLTSVSMALFGCGAAGGRGEGAAIRAE